MPILTSGSNVTLTVAAGQILTVQSDQATFDFENPVGTRVGEYACDSVFGPFVSAGSVKITSVQGPVYYELASRPVGQSVPFDPSSVAIASVKLSPYGALGDGLANDGPAVQAAIDAVYAAGGGVLTIPRGVYVTAQTLYLKPGVWLRGVGGKDNANSECRITAAQSLNGPLLVNDASLGTVAGTGIDGNVQRLYGCGIENICLSNFSLLSMDCDALRLTNAWTVSLRQVGLRAKTGFALRALDCNVLHVSSCWSSGAIFCESLADSSFIDNQFGPIGYPSVDNDYISSTFWLTGSDAWKNNIIGNFIYNAPNGVARACTVTSGSTLIPCAAHGYTDGTPVTYSSTGTFGVSGDATFYVKAVDADNIRFCTSRANVASSTYVTPAATGTGTQTLRVGGRGCLFMNDGARNNVIASNRFDQGYWENVHCRGTTMNQFVGNSIREGGRANATAGVAGFLLSNTTDELLTGNFIDGTDVVTSTGNSNQDVGLSIASTCVRTKLIGNRVANHAQSNISDSTSTTVYDVSSVFVSPYTFVLRQGVPALTFLTGSRRQAWALDATTDESVQAFMKLPTGAAQWDVKGFLTNLGAGAGNVTVAVQIDEYSDGDSAAANEATTLGATLAAPAQDALKVSSFGNYTPKIASLGSITFKRTGTDAGDTLANDMGFLGLLFTPRPN